MTVVRARELGFFGEGVMLKPVEQRWTWACHNIGLRKMSMRINETRKDKTARVVILRITGVEGLR
jgi:hypothetical protein